MHCPVCGSNWKLSNHGLNIECENKKECGFEIKQDSENVYLKVGNFKAQYKKDIADKEREAIQNKFVVARDNLAMKLNEQYFYKVK